MPRGLTLSKRVDDGSKSKSRGWMDGNRGGLTAGILKSAEEYTTTLHGDGDGDGEKNSGSGGGDSVGGGGGGTGSPAQDSPVGNKPHRFKEMLQMRHEAGKHARKLEGNHSYDLNPEKTFKALEDIELLSTGRSVRMSTHHATKLSRQLLESTARLRKMRDHVAQRAIEKEDELEKVRNQIADAERNSQNTFMGAKGEHQLNKRMDKHRRRLQRVEEKLEMEEFQTKKLERMKWHLNNAIRGHQRAGFEFEREIQTVMQSDGHARRKRLELYQSLAREKRALDKIADKVERIRLVQKTKLQEVADCASEQRDKFDAEQRKREKRKRRVTQQIAEANKKTLSRLGAKTFKINAKKNAIDIQLAPLEDVFYKVRVRTGLSNLSTDQIVELFHSQEHSIALLRKDATDSMEEIERLRDKIEQHRDAVRRMENAAKETSHQKSFYHELDIVEKRSAHAEALTDRRREDARKASLNVTCVGNFVKKMARELDLLQLDEYNRKEPPISMRTITSCVKEKKYEIALLELHRVIKVLQNGISGVVGGAGGAELGTGAGMQSLDMTVQSRTNTSEEGNNNSVSNQVDDRRTKRGVMAPEDGSDSPQSSPMSASLALPTTSTGNIRVATRRATKDNGYDSDADFSPKSISGGNGGMAAWQTPRDGVSLRGGEGLPPTGRRAPSTASSTSSSRRPSRPGGKRSEGGGAVGGDKKNHVNIFGEATARSSMSVSETEGEEDRACKTQRSQIKQVTSMVLYRARKLSVKGDKPVGSIIPKSPRRRSLMVDDDGDDLAMLSRSFGPGDNPKKVSMLGGPILRWWWWWRVVC